MTDSYDPPRVIREKFPLTLPMELALGIDTVKNICQSYGIEKAEWDVLREDPLFVRAVTAALKSLEREGMSFRIKARIQAEELLKTSWNLIHGQEVPAAVKADLIKSTVKWADYEPKPNVPGAAGAGFSISINLAAPSAAGQNPAIEGEAVRENTAMAIQIPGRTPAPNETNETADEEEQ